MYRAPSKKRQLIIRTGVYSLMTTLVVLLVTFLVFIMLGYRFNKDTSSIQQGGLVQFVSRPTDAKVTIGNAQLTDTTPSKITVNPGNYNVMMTRSGYKNWSKNVDVRAGEVLWLNYTQLVPNTIKTESVYNFEALSAVKSSPNGDRYAVIPDGSKPVLNFVDVTADQPKITTINIQAELLPDGKSPVYELLNWANDSDRILVKLTYEGVTEYVVVDRRDEKRTLNITKEYEADIAELIFDPRTSERLIARSSKGDIRIIDTANKSQSNVIASTVTDMDVYGNDAILLVQSSESGAQSVGYVSLGSNKVRTLKQIASNEKTLLSIGKYFSDVYIAVSTGAKLDVYKVRSLPSSESESPISLDSIHSTTLPAAADYLSVRSGGRFVVAQYAGGIETYDNELSKQTLTSFTQPVANELRWLDKYHFYLTNGSNLEVMEFDGGNPHTIAPLSTGFDSVQSDDGKYIYSITAGKNGGYELQRSQMILD